MDSYDKKILKALQRNGRITNKELAAQVSLSQAPCWRRVDALEKQGLIKGYTAIVDQDMLGLNITAFAQISLENHHPETVQQFDQGIQQWPEILECHATSGESDYLLKIVASDMNAYNQLIYEKILRLPSIRSINTSFSMQQKKRTSHLPIVETG
ncbi:Lrp/AsnC family transcriptional regulator [Marinicella sp. S1101]|uniref:Lrp/AsnC family transcriptional regulator n=1 Tax=Marinicella marina TaxID=2996016 RepID=UPI0022608EC6|nr:Lrp/AsnC family transcriptional regulator [Marinicella marina]MCX7552500.1 Lrp/AsnC family transcriptional regulator [Marinicella marina]